MTRDQLGSPARGHASKDRDTLKGERLRFLPLARNHISDYNAKRSSRTLQLIHV